jgi:hypothetical protein
MVRFASDVDGIVFIKGTIPNVRILGRVRAMRNGFLGLRGHESEADVRRALAEKVRAQGGNCLLNFKCGKTSSFRSALFRGRAESWFGSGDVAVLETPQD